MRFVTEVSVSELKALLEIIQEIAKREGIDEVVTKSVLNKLNEKHFR